MIKYIIISALLLLIGSLNLQSVDRRIVEAIDSIFNYEKPDNRLPMNLISTANPVEGISNTISGYLSVDDPNSNSKLFYIFYQCRNLSSGQSPSDVPLIIWLQGGPGNGSELSAFYEMGPYELTYDQSSGKYTESPRAQSWTDYYNMLFIDSPRGSGYSIADQGSFVTSEDQISADLLNALKNFYNLTEFQAFSNTPLYVFGSGYAGHYIPGFVKSVLAYNQQSQSPRIPITGVGIGNGLVDPMHQFATNGLFAFNLGLVDDVQRQTIEHVQLDGVSKILYEDYGSAQDDFDHVINLITSCGGGLNTYNYRQFGSYDFSALTTFFNDPDTVTRYNVDPSVAGKFGVNNAIISENLRNETMKTIIDNLADILAQVSVLIYAGQDDLIYNSPGIQNWIANFEWTGQSPYYASQFNLWVYENGTVAGLQKNSGQFTFALVDKAGHYAAMEQIATTTEMVRRFVNKQDNWSQPL